MRKDKGFEVTDKIYVKVLQNDYLNDAIKNNLSYICSETLTGNLEMVEALDLNSGILVEVDDAVSTYVSIEKLN